MGVQVDTSPSCHIDNVMFTLELKDSSASINGVAGAVSGDDEHFSVTLSSPVTIRSGLPHSRATFRAMGCEFMWKSGDYSDGWWYSLEGKLRGTTNQHYCSGKFKGRFQHSL